MTQPKTTRATYRIATRHSGDEVPLRSASALIEDLGGSNKGRKGGGAQEI